MQNNFFKKLEHLPANSSVNLAEAMDHLVFNDDGLIPVITQDATTQKVLMFAWMNREALQLTLSTKRMTYWSRSRRQLWIKGETSGHIQKLVSMNFDCDGDVILCQVSQAGAACHTGRENCFYLKVDSDQQKISIIENE